MVKFSVTYITFSFFVMSLYAFEYPIAMLSALYNWNSSWKLVDTTKEYEDGYAKPRWSLKKVRWSLKLGGAHIN